jgi:membrane-bound lytic murein transglycosylase F
MYMPVSPINFIILRIFTISGLIILSVALIGCGNDKSSSQSELQELTNTDQTDTYTELGDLPALKKRGQLRILVPLFSDDDNYLPRQGFPLHYEANLLNRFSANVGLEPKWIFVNKFDELIPLLLAGKGDLIAANLTVTQSRKEQIGFTVPITIVREQLVTKSGDTIKKIRDLAGRTIAVQKSVSFWQTVQGLKRKIPKMKIQVVEEGVSVEAIMNDVANARYELTVADSNLAIAVLAYNQNLKVAFDLTDDRAIAWGLRPDAKRLKRELDRFVVAEKLGKQEKDIYRADFTEIKKRKVLRVLTRNNAATYFLWRGELLGFEYELIHAFAKKHGLRIKMVVPPSRDDLLPWLLDGKGDIIAASLTATQSRKDRGVVFSQKTNKVSEQLVARSNESKIKSIQDLVGRKIFVRRSSSYWQTIRNLINAGIDIRLREVPESLETEEIIAKVASGEYDLSVADSHILDIELTWRDDVEAALDLGKPVLHGWAMRQSDKILHAEVNSFLKKEYRGLFYNILQQKYFKTSHKIKRRLEQRVDKSTGGDLSPYDTLVKKYSKKHDFDWRLIVSQMYQESQFDPKAKSWVGALGLMQVMPRTAREMNISNLEEPENGMRAGVQYMAWLWQRFEPELDIKDRYWFALAAYNAGLGHVRDARRLAKKQGWKANRWFDNVEKAMLLLSKRQFSRHARHGYVRGREPVNYVRNIQNRYQAYLQLTGVASY